MEPFYDLDELTIKRIFEFIDKCQELGVENNCFIYDPKLETEVKFYMVKHPEHWELTVIQNWRKKRDFYKIKGKSLSFAYSEQD